MLASYSVTSVLKERVHLLSTQLEIESQHGHVSNGLLNRKYLVGVEVAKNCGVIIVSLQIFPISSLTSASHLTLGKQLTMCNGFDEIQLNAMRKF